MKLVGDGDSVEHVGNLSDPKLKKEISNKRKSYEIKENILITSYFEDITVIIPEDKIIAYYNNGFLTDDAFVILVEGSEVYFIYDEPRCFSVSELGKLKNTLTEKHLEKVKEWINKYNVKYIIIHN